MIVKTTLKFDDFKKKLNLKVLKFKDNSYFCHTHRVLSLDKESYDSQTHYHINKNEDTDIPDEVINTKEFQEYFTLGFLEEVI